MPENDTLLAHLAPWVDETLATEALSYILNESRAARQALDELLKDGGLDVAPITEVKTQVTIPSGARVDLVGYGNQVVEPVFIEVKFSAALTARQPNDYLDYLVRRGGQSVLLFLAPESRIKTLWPELRASVERNGNALVEVEAERKCMRVKDTDCHLMVVSWRTLLESMAIRTRATQENPAVVGDIDQLIGLARRKNQEHEGRQAFTDKYLELGDTPDKNRELDLREIVRQTIVRASRTEWADSVGLTVGRSTIVGYDGRYFRFTKSGLEPWLGIHYTLWKEHAKTPIWLRFGSVSEKPGWIRQFQLDRVCDYLSTDAIGDNCFPMYLKRGVEREAVIDDLVSQLNAIADVIESATAAES